jgi:hypothetical protein
MNYFTAGDKLDHPGKIVVNKTEFVIKVRSKFRKLIYSLQNVVIHNKI